MSTPANAMKLPRSDLGISPVPHPRRQSQKQLFGTESGDKQDSTVIVNVDGSSYTLTDGHINVTLNSDSQASSSSDDSESDDESLCPDW